MQCSSVGFSVAGSSNFEQKSPTIKGTVRFEGANDGIQIRYKTRKLPVLLALAAGIAGTLYYPSHIKPKLDELGITQRVNDLNIGQHLERLQGQAGELINSVMPK